MLKGLLIGILLGILLVAGSVYLYFSTGRAPVATAAAPMPFEKKFARMGFHAYMEKLPHLQPGVAADETNFLAGAQIYKEHCAVCHGFPGHEKSAIATGMFPAPPQLFRGTGVTDDEPWETYWTISGGVRMTGMPGFKEQLNDTQIWQVAQLLKNADKISDAVKTALAPEAASAVAAPATSPAAATPVPPGTHK